MLKFTDNYPSDKRFAIGNSDFRFIVEEGYKFVDKTLLIKEILEDGAQTKLFLRQRRFGKTLSMSMLNYYFSNTEENTEGLFEKFKIWTTEEKY